METIHLIGSEDVSRAGHNMQSAAQQMNQAANNMDAALNNFQKYMTEWIERFEEAISHMPHGI